MKMLRRMATGARDQLREEMGPEIDDVDWRKLDPRQYDPRRIIREALTDEFTDIQAGPKSSHAASSASRQAHPAAPGPVSPAGDPRSLPLLDSPDVAEPPLTSSRAPAREAVPQMNAMPVETASTTELTAITGPPSQTKHGLPSERTEKTRCDQAAVNTSEPGVTASTQMSE